MPVQSLQIKDECGRSIARGRAMKDEGFKEGVGLRESDKLVSREQKRTCFACPIQASPWESSELLVSY